jgi:hypothetical protein
MYDVTYKVVFAGDLIPHRDLEEVLTHMAGLFGGDKAAAKKLFGGNKHRVKSNLNLVDARKYVRALARLGALSYIEQEVVEHSEPLASPAPQDGQFLSTGDFDLEAVQQYFAEQEARKKAQLEKTAEYKLYSLDEMDELPSEAPGEDMEPTGVHKLLDAGEVARMLNKKSV